MSEFAKYYYALSKIKGLNSDSLSKLIKLFGDPQKAWHSETAPLINTDKNNIFFNFGAFKQFREKIDLENEWQRIRNAEVEINVQTIDWHDKDYPMLLKEIDDAPPILFYQGDRKLFSHPLKIAMVGTRLCNHYGESQSKLLAGALSQSGFCVVSGMAQGVDGFAHQSVLDAQGKTIGVLGHGHEFIYPSAHKNLFKHVFEKGLLVSEFAPWVEANTWTFPKRNRLISGLSMGVVIIQGSAKSGSMITARHALDQNREVFALPGPIDQEISEGPNRLIQQGAKLIQNPNDILEEFKLSYPHVKIQTPELLPLLTAEEKSILNLLSGDPVGIDLLMAKTGLNIGALSLRLIELEKKSLIQLRPGKYYIKTC
jgi:DNA processing protein